MSTILTPALVHANRHAAGGGDPLTPALIGAGNRALDWVAGRAYVVGEVAVNGALLYRCNTAHTSIGAFDSSKFTAITSGGGGATRTDTIWVDDMAGATDDAKFLMALATAQAQSFPPVIRFSNRLYDMTTGGLTPYPGMTIWGPEGYSNPERSGYSMGCQIKLSLSGGWFDNSAAGDTYSVSFGNLSFKGTSTASVITQSGGSSLYCLYMHNISSSGLKSVLGTQASKLLITAAQFDGGAWEINNCYDGAFHLGGSDNALWTNGCLMDSAPAYVGSGQYHLWCDGLDKTYIGPLYITCEGDWGGIKVSGVAYNGSTSNNQGIVVINGAKIEGRNPAQPCNGANILVTGGQLTLRDCWVAYGMSSPAAMGHSPTDAGVIMQTGGRLVVSGGQYDRTSGQAETVPYIYASGGSTRVNDVSVAARGGTWAGLPRVTSAGGSVVVDTTTG